MKSLLALPLIGLLISLSYSADCQYMEKVVFDAADSSNGHYIAIPPASKNIRGVLVFFCSLRTPEYLLPETKLHNVAAANDLLTVYASLGKSLVADPAAIDRINTILRHIAAKYTADTARFVLGAYDEAGSIVLRFTELAYEHPAGFALRPAAVFGVSSFVDLSGFYHWCNGQIKKNFFPPAVGDANFYLDLMNKELGTITDHPEKYKELSPFSKEEDTAGNEQFLRRVPLRLYYDADISWQLNARRNSLYDTNIPDGTELIKRLLLAGNTRAELMISKQPGIRSNGIRTPSALSIMDETDCIQWTKRVMHILDPSNPMAWEAPYRFIVPEGWRMERAYLPGPFASHVTIHGVEDIRFPGGWGDAKSPEYWSVAYLLWLDGGQKIDADVLQNNLKIYYDDLIAGAFIRRNIHLPADKIIPAKVTVSIKKIKAEADDKETYTGTINMFDYLGQRPMTLNYLVHVKVCDDQRHIPVFFEISPQPFDHPLWRELKQMKEKFSCGE